MHQRKAAAEIYMRPLRKRRDPAGIFKGRGGRQGILGQREDWGGKQQAGWVSALRRRGSLGVPRRRQRGGGEQSHGETRGAGERRSGGAKRRGAGGTGLGGNAMAGGGRGTRAGVAEHTLDWTGKVCMEEQYRGDLQWMPKVVSHGHARFFPGRGSFWRNNPNGGRSFGIFLAIAEVFE